MGKKFLAIFICLLLTLFSCSCSNLTSNIVPIDDTVLEDSKLTVHFIDVGQGDCTLLKSGDDAVLIDAGESEYGDTVCQYIKNLDIKSLDYVIATHPHSDHCGGLTQVLNTFTCDNFITIETDQQTSVWLDVLNAVDQNNVNYIDRQVGATYTFGQSSFEILGPYDDTYDNYNNYSVIVKATCGKNSFLFTGDAEEPVEKELINNNADLRADVLKVSHHGSSTSSCKQFLSYVNPSYAIISCGANNDYGHPHIETTTALDSRGVITYRTDILGHIVAATDGENINFYYQKTDETINTAVTHSSDELSYVGNKNSKKFHLSICDSIAQMNEDNKIYFDNRDQAVNDGYTPCKSCNP